MGTHKIYSGIQGKEITYEGVYMETAMNYLPVLGKLFERRYFHSDSRLVPSDHYPPVASGDCLFRPICGSCKPFFV